MLTVSWPLNSATASFITVTAHLKKMRTALPLNHKIKKLIKYQRKDRILNHLKTVLWTDAANYSGQISNDKFTLWRYSAWTGIFYPVLIGSITSVDGEEKIEIQTKLNKAGCLLSFAFLGLWGYAILFGIIIQEDNSWTYLWKRTLGGFVLFGLFAYVPFLIYRRGRRTEIKSLEEWIKNVR